MDPRVLQKLDELQKRIEDLEQQLRDNTRRRIYQQDIVPSAVKMRAMGEANRFVRSGLDKDLPSKPETGTGSSASYFATDTNKWYVHNGTAWKSTTLS